MKAQPHVPLPHAKRAASRARPEPLIAGGLVVLAAAWGLISFQRAISSSAPAPAPAEPDVLPMPSAVEAAAAVETRAESPALASVVAVPSVLPAALSAAAFPVVDHGGAFGPSWAKAVPAQWAWPTRVVGFASGVLKAGFSNARAAAGLPARRLSGWFPGNPRGRQLQFAILNDDGSETRVYEEEFDAKYRAAVKALMPAIPVFVAAAPTHAMTPAEQEDYNRAARAHHEASKAALAASRKNVASVRDVSPDGQMVGDFEVTYKDGHKETVRFDPLVFDLKGTGVKTNERKTLFDLYGYHKDDKIQWMNDIDEGTGILVFDSNGSGKSGKSGSEVFGDRTELAGIGRPDGFADGFAALNALVEKAVKQGVVSRDVLDQGVLESDSLSSLEKAYGLRMKVGGFNGRTVSLAEAGVKAIALSQKEASRVEDFDGRRNDLLVQPGAVFMRGDGSTGYYMNVWLAAKTGNLGLEGK